MYIIKCIKWVSVCVLYIFFSGMVEASGNCSGHLDREESTHLVSEQQTCANKYNFENLVVETCQAGSGKISLDIHIKNNSTNPSFKKELGDSYYIKPVMFKKISEECDEILIVDHGAEFSYGAMVFSVGKKGVKYLGMIDLVANQGDDSIVSHMSLKRCLDGKLIFQFDTDMYIPTKQGIYKKIAKEKASYRYDIAHGLQLSKNQPLECNR